MTFKNAQQSRVLVGPLHYSGYTTKVNFGLDVMMLNRTTLIDTAQQFQPGMDGSGFQLDLLLDTDTTAGGEWSNLTTWKTSQPSLLTYAPAGLVTGSECWMTSTLMSSFNQTSTTNDLVKASLSGVTDGLFDPGVIVEDLTAITIDGNGVARDNGAATSNGGVAHLHATAFSGLTNNIVTIEHSVDGSTAWATLVTFATYTAIASERVVVAAGTTVRRYLRVVDNVTGTGSTTRAVSFARR